MAGGASLAHECDVGTDDGAAVHCQLPAQELPDYIQEGLEVHYASEYDDVYKVALDYSEQESTPVAEA